MDTSIHQTTFCVIDGSILYFRSSSLLQARLVQATIPDAVVVDDTLKPVNDTVVFVGHSPQIDEMIKRSNVYFTQLALKPLFQVESYRLRAYDYFTDVIDAMI